MKTITAYDRWQILGLEDPFQQRVRLVALATEQSEEDVAKLPCAEFDELFDQAFPMLNLQNGEKRHLEADKKKATSKPSTSD